MATTTTNPAANGRQQKSLAHQLDRLDTIFDGLAEALNESVAEAVRAAVVTAVREAVEVALTEVLSRPELLRAALAAHGGPAAGATEPKTEEASPGRRLRRAGGRVAAGARGAVAWVGQAAVRVNERTRQVLTLLGDRTAAVARGCGRVVAGVATFAAATATAALGAAWRRRVRLVASATAGLAAGTFTFLAGPWAATAACGLSSAALVLSCTAPRLADRPGAPAAVSL